MQIQDRDQQVGDGENAGSDSTHRSTAFARIHNANLTANGIERLHHTERQRMRHNIALCLPLGDVRLHSPRLVRQPARVWKVERAFNLRDGTGERLLGEAGAKPRREGNRCRTHKYSVYANASLCARDDGVTCDGAVDGGSGDGSASVRVRETCNNTLVDSARVDRSCCRNSCGADFAKDEGRERDRVDARRKQRAASLSRIQDGRVRGVVVDPPEIRCNILDLSDCASRNELASLLDEREEWHPVCLHQEQFLLLRGLDHFGRLFRIQRKGLFAEHVLVVTQRKQDVVPVRSGGSRNIDDVNLGIVHKLLICTIRLTNIVVLRKLRCGRL
eukprot:Opistho-2@69220